MQKSFYNYFILSVICFLCFNHCNSSNVEDESSLLLVGFYPFVAKLPVWVFDVPQNYQVNVTTPCSDNSLCEPITAADLQKKSNIPGSGIFSVSLNEYLIVSSKYFSCEPHNRIPFIDTDFNQFSSNYESSMRKCDLVSDCDYFAVSSTSDVLCSGFFQQEKGKKNNVTIGIKTRNLLNSNLENYHLQYNAGAECPDSSILSQSKFPLMENDGVDFSWTLPFNISSYCDSISECKSISILFDENDDSPTWIVKYCSVILKDFPTEYGYIYATKINDFE